jgi:hypothetical protein
MKLHQLQNNNTPSSEPYRIETGILEEWLHMYTQAAQLFKTRITIQIQSVSTNHLERKKSLRGRCYWKWGRK